jgi:hypothetical protein
VSSGASGGVGCTVSSGDVVPWRSYLTAQWWVGSWQARVAETITPALDGTVADGHRMERYFQQMDLLRFEARLAALFGDGGVKS